MLVFCTQAYLGRGKKLVNNIPADSGATLLNNESQRVLNILSEDT